MAEPVPPTGPRLPAASAARPGPGPVAMRLVRPAAEHLAAYTAALRRGWSADNVRGAAAAAEELAAIQADPARYLAGCEDRAAVGGPVTLPDGSQVARLPGFKRWIWLDAPGGGPATEASGAGDAAAAAGEGGFAGSINFRWQPGTAELPPHVLGHIGYAVVPWQRRRGLATAALAALLPEAWAEGLPHVDLTTDVDNLASHRVIEANGGAVLHRFTKPAAFGGQPGLWWRVVRR